MSNDECDRNCMFCYYRGICRIANERFSKQKEDDKK